MRLAEVLREGGEGWSREERVWTGVVWGWRGREEDGLQVGVAEAGSATEETLAGS